MSSGSSFDGQVLHEFDDLLPKPFSTDSDSDHYLDVESTGATISSKLPPPTVPTSSQSSIPPSTPGITDSLFSLEIAPVESTDCSRGRKRMGRPRKRIYARRHKVGIPTIVEDTSSQLQDPIPPAPRHTVHKFSKLTHFEDISLNFAFHVPPILDQLTFLNGILRGLHLHQLV